MDRIARIAAWWGWSLLLLSQGASVTAEDELLPEDTAVVDMQLPAGARVTLNAQDYGTKRRFKYESLKRGTTYTVDATIDFGGDKRQERRLLIDGGRTIRLGLLAPVGGLPQLILQTGHTDSVHSVAFSPDGRRVLSGSRDGTLRLWDVETGRELRRFEGHKGWVASVAFSPDGRRALSGSSDNTLRLWDAETGRELQRFEGHTKTVHSVAFSPDGRRALSGSWDNTLRLWDVETGLELQRFEGHTGWVWSVAFSPDGRRVLSGSVDKTLRLWDVETGRELRRFEGHTDQVLSVAFSPDGRRVLSGGEDNTLRLWDVETGRELQRFEGYTSEVRSVAFSPDGRRVFSGGGDTTLRLWDVETGRELRRFEGHTNAVRSVAFSPDGRRVLSGSVDKTLRLWDVETGRELQRFEGHTKTVHSVAFSPDGRRALSGSGDTTLRLWDVETGRELRRFEGHTSEVKSVAFSPDGRRVLSGSEDGTLRLWDIATGDELARMVNLRERGVWLVVTPEGLFDGSEGGRQKVTFRVGEGLNVVPVDRFFQDCYRPGLLAEIWQGRRPLPEFQVGKSLPPSVTIVSPAAGAVSTQQVTLDVEALDQGGGVSGLAIYQNGARVLAPGQTRTEGKTVHRSFTLALVEGQNRLRVAAASGDGSWEAEPAEIVLTYEKPLAKSQLHLFAVGINHYGDANLNLNYAAKDARAFSELFHHRGRTLYQHVHVTTLTDEQATRSGIYEALKKVAAETRPQDTLVVFLAGHGTMVGQRYYFVPYELRRQAERLEDDIRRQGLPADELSDYLGAAKALKRVLILDTCASGGALGVALRSRSGFALRGAVERLSRTQGISTIAAAAATEEAQEAQQLGHGVLSYALLAGLKAVDAGPLEGQYVRPSSPEGVVDVLEWFQFASSQVPRVTEKIYGTAQDVQISTRGMSFPVLPVSD